MRRQALTRQLHRFPAIPAGLACLLALTWPAVLLADDDGEAPEAEATEVATVPPPQPLASLDDLYDFKPLAEVDPAYKALYEAFARRQFGPVVRQAADVASRSGQPAVVQAALYLQAMAHEGLRDWAGAEKAWQRLAQSGALAQRARQRLADLALKRKDVDGALAQLAAVAPWHVGRDLASLQMAQLELDRDHVGPARDALERIQPAMLSRTQRGLYQLLRGEVARRSGKTAEAIAAYREAWNLDEGPHDQQAVRHLHELGAAPSPADQIERILRRREIKTGQLQTWLHEAEAITENEGGLRAYVQGALLAREKPTRGRALELLRQATELLTEPTQLARALYALGDTLGKAGQDREAIDLLRRIQTLDAAEDVKARALQRLHRLYKAVDQPAEAEQVLRKLLDQHPNADERELAIWGLAWQRFLAADYPAALKLFVQLEREHGHLWTGAHQPWRAKAIYWQARCLQQMGQTEAALEAWSSAANTYAQTYYGILSLDRIREIDPDRAVRLAGPPPSPADAAQNRPSLDRVRVSRNAALDEAVLLLRAGQVSEGLGLLRHQLARGLPRDGIHLLATLYELQGARRAAYGVLQRHTRRAARPDDSTAGVWRQSFPKAFFTEADSAAQGAGIGRSYLYAIMRHESSFVPTAVSKAGAYGLVQLLPSAAKAVAELHAVPVQGTKGLLQPAYNLQVGALYLSQLLSFFKGHQPVAAAAYNAGPYAARDWVKKWGHLPADAFVECIPYPATRAYVMQVTATAQTYAWLYPEWQELDRDQFSRGANLPQGFGPFMQRPQAQRLAY